MELELTLAILLSWASHLSGYPVPDNPPAVRFETHEFFVENACGGVDCNVVGWYDDKDVVYIDVRYRELDSDFANSLVVHELTHFLQHRSGNFDSLSCEDSVAREREAYSVQNRYIIEALASINTIMPGQTVCSYANAGVDSESEHSHP